MENLKLTPEDRLTAYAQTLGLNGYVSRHLTFPRHLAYFWMQTRPDSSGYDESDKLGENVDEAAMALAMIGEVGSARWSDSFVA